MRVRADANSSLCYLAQQKLCPSRRKVDPKTVAKRVPVYYVDGTMDRGYGKEPVEDKKEVVENLKKLEW